MIRLHGAVLALTVACILSGYWMAVIDVSVAAGFEGLYDLHMSPASNFSAQNHRMANLDVSKSFLACFEATFRLPTGQLKLIIQYRLLNFYFTFVGFYCPLPICLLVGAQVPYAVMVTQTPIS